MFAAIFVNAGRRRPLNTFSSNRRFDTEIREFREAKNQARVWLFKLIFITVVLALYEWAAGNTSDSDFYKIANSFFFIYYSVLSIYTILRVKIACQIMCLSIGQ